jgi:hypothetical protein
VKFLLAKHDRYHSVRGFSTAKLVNRGDRITYTAVRTLVRTKHLWTQDDETVHSRASSHNNLLLGSYHADIVGVRRSLDWIT